MKVVMLAGKGPSSRYMYNGLKNEYNIIKVIIEDTPSKVGILRRRIKRIGFLKVIGQVIFIILSKFLCKISSSRMKQLIPELGLSEEPINNSIIMHVKNINSTEVIKVLQSINPDAVVVNGTRILSEDVLSSVNAKFLNTHLGITPKYRGVHGGYWALANGDINNCGTTVHLVDTGIDTGGILYQDVIQVSKEDNYCTYPLHQISIGIDMMKKALKDIELDRLLVKKNGLESKLWYHPDIITYLNNWLFKGVK